ncbi:hypothetical protein ColTof4_01360 [Colletotrichum tofieldiae]|nr:hypothetical protein ColTof4_01360 [Colletotrichum tofieldiae]GKT96797.1 hypothetical protein Ct61P_14647 [Colletotrichum tofieldiae]
MADLDSASKPTANQFITNRLPSPLPSKISQAILRELVNKREPIKQCLKIADKVVNAPQRTDKRRQSLMASLDQLWPACLVVSESTTLRHLVTVTLNIVLITRQSLKP